MTTASERHSLPWFATMSGTATLVASALATQLLLTTSSRLDPHSWTVTTQASLQIALALALFSAAGTVLGWYAGARSPALRPRTAGWMIGVASALFVVVAGIVTAAALMPDVGMVLLSVPIPAAVGGAAAGVSLARSRRPRRPRVPGEGWALVATGAGARPGAVRPVRVAPVQTEASPPAAVAVTAVPARAAGERAVPRGGAEPPQLGAALAAIAPVEREADRGL
ncbi:hypothetical protein N1031_05390 [Herbiconiux moechotypicola]|uniref:Uncharacterized protein n=1 Tax=Herbiconiux moechotypicola TaxID=637393 RepID=A0ABN3DEY7_9MICO|nr:hypothetical protein [Herbiconiux moechotypicola]MCS5729189.1 hypothetical protein [Herbiconiux moechotypicola]